MIRRMAGWQTAARVLADFHHEGHEDHAQRVPETTPATRIVGPWEGPAMAQCPATIWGSLRRSSGLPSQ